MLFALDIESSLLHFELSPIILGEVVLAAWAHVASHISQSGLVSLPRVSSKVSSPIVLGVSSHKPHIMSTLGASVPFKTLVSV